jgi:hypothetical protein
VTGLSFQFAARRLRVLLRGVFHLGFATLYSVYVVARAQARVEIRAARAAQAFAFVTAPQSHRQNGQNDLPHEIGHVEPSIDQHVPLTKGVVRAVDIGVEPFAHLDLDRPYDVLEASVAVALGFYAYGAFDQEDTVGAPRGEVDVGRLFELDALERFDRNPILQFEDLARSGEEALDIDGVRTCHDYCSLQYERPRRRRSPQGPILRGGCLDVKPLGGAAGPRDGRVCPSAGAPQGRRLDLDRSARSIRPSSDPISALTKFGLD